MTSNIISIMNSKSVQTEISNEDAKKLERLFMDSRFETKKSFYSYIIEKYIEDNHE